MLTRERPGVLGAGTVLRRRARRGATCGGSGGRATRRAQRPRRLRRKPRAACSRRRRARADRERGGVGAAGVGLRARSISKRTRGSRHRRIWGWRWHASPPDASTRPSARRYAASVCDARHSPPWAMRMHCSYSPRSRLARSRLARAANDLERAKRAIAEFPDPGRLPAIAATIEQTLVAARATAGSRELVEEPSPAELAVLRGLAAGLSRREIGARALHLAEYRQESHARAVPQTRCKLANRGGGPRRGARPARVHSITRVILGTGRPTRSHGRACWVQACRPTTTASSSKGSSDPATPRLSKK